MKILLSTLLIAGLLGTASTAMAGTVVLEDKVQWNGNTGNMPDICTFVGTPPATGAMSFDESSSTWTTTAPAVVHLKNRGHNNLTVTNVGHLYQGTSGSSTVVPVTVNYTGSSAEMNDGSALTTNAGSSSISVSMNNAVGVVKLSIGGTAEHTQEVVLAKNMSYHVKHKITCTQ